MFRQLRWVVAALLLAGVGIAFAGTRGVATEVAIGGDPAVVTPIAGAGHLHRIKLDADSAARIGLATGTVGQLPATRPKKGAAQSLSVVPIGAVLYDKDGATWVYAETAPLTFQRKPVTVVSADGNRVVLSSGPAVGSRVATVGAAELRGSEEGVPGE